MTTKRDELKAYAEQHGWREQNQYARAALFLEWAAAPYIRMEVYWTDITFTRIDHVLVLDQNRSGSNRISTLTGGLPAVKRYLREKA